MEDWKKRMIDTLTWGVVYPTTRTHQRLNDLMQWDCKDDQERAEVKAYFDAQWAAHAEAQTGWAEPTDNDRLEAAFEALKSRDIAALHATGETQSSGWESAHEYRHRHGADGAVFYTHQDVERVLGSCDDLMLAHGAFSDDDDANQAVANTIASVLREHGFSLDWDGTHRMRIAIKPFTWQRRRKEA